MEESLAKIITALWLIALKVGAVLTLVFIILRLCQVILWSWWSVLSPILIALATPIIILLIIGVCVLVAKFFIFIFERLGKKE